jgi:hypothetical protein
MSVHIITVTALDNTHLDLPDEQYVDGVQFTVECPGGTGCNLWWECTECREYEPTEDEDDDGEFTRHGVFHRNLEGMWCTESDQCAATHSDSCSEAVQEAAQEAGEYAGLGVHQIELDYEGDGDWSARRVIPPEEKARIDARAQELYQQGLPSRGPWDDQPFGVREYFRGKVYREERSAALTATEGAQ